MSIYRGVVRNNAIVLVGDVHLREGAEVEIVVDDTGMAPGSHADPELSFQLAMVAAGLLTGAPLRRSAPPDWDYSPVVAPGKPLSEIIVDDRR